MAASIHMYVCVTNNRITNFYSYVHMLKYIVTYFMQMYMYLRTYIYMYRIDMCIMRYLVFYLPSLSMNLDWHIYV